MEEIVTVVSENGCYPDDLKSELNDNKVIVIDEFFEVVSPIYDNYHKNGNNEKLYSSIFSKVILDAKKYIGLSRDVSTLLMKKLADRFTSLRKELKTAEEESDEESIDTTKEPWIPFQYQHLPELSEKERHGLRYIGGYVYKKLYKKLKNSKEWKSPYCQMAMSFLEAGKDNDIDDSFLDDINRGGLWKISTSAEELFRVVEAIFCKNTSKKCLRVIHTDDILLQCYRDHRVIQCCQTLLISTEMEIDFKVSKDMVFGILTLYLRVRAFSKVRKILEDYKEKARISAKEKGLRKDIKQKSGKQSN
uniref:Uncharacterized protein n=1 Tax=Clytia hemisphaerica TaxID=252671 RepID=A0A7M5XI81_9CNID